ncbi:MAG: hypothetical protein ACE5JM_08585 [Armatimonadota bacterium]
MICQCVVALAALTAQSCVQAPPGGLDRLTELVKQPAPGASVVEYLPGEPILVYHRITNPSTQPARVSVWDLDDKIRVSQPDGQRLWQYGEQIFDDPVPGTGQFALKAGGKHEGYRDLTLLYAWVLPEEGELDVFLPWPRPGRTQRIRIAAPGTAREGWHSDYVKLQQVKRWIRGRGGEIDPRARVDPPVGLGVLEEIAEGRTYLREWAMYYKAWYIQRVLAKQPEEKGRWKTRWLPQMMQALRDFLDEYPQSVVAPHARAYVDRYADPGSRSVSRSPAQAHKPAGRAAAGSGAPHVASSHEGSGDAAPAPDGGNTGRGRGRVVLAVVLVPVAAVAVVAVVIARRHRAG